MNTGAMAQGQITAVSRQPFAPSAVDVIDSIVITQELNTSNVLAEWIAHDPTISVFSSLNTAQAVKLFLNWSDHNGALDLHQGDFFTFIVPDIFIPDFIDNVTNVPIFSQTEGGVVVATYTIFDNISGMKEVIITFTDYVENHTNISGNFWMLLFVGSVAEKEEKILQFVINDELAAQGVVTVNPSPGFTPNNRKVGFSSTTNIVDDFYVFEWLVFINMTENAVNGFNTLEGFTFEDIIPADSPHVFLTDAIRQEFGLLPTDFASEIGEYTGADSAPPQIRFQAFLNQYNSVDANTWYNFIQWHTLINGLTSVGINGEGGLDVANIEVAEKLYSASLGTITRPTVIRFFTISTIMLKESALGDSEVVKLFRNMFHGSYGENLNATLTLYRFEAGGTAQGIFGDLSFDFTKVNEASEALPGAMFSLFTSDDFTLGADRFAFSGTNGVVVFNHLPAGTYFMLETAAPFGYLPNNTVYKVELTGTGFEIFFGPNFENRLSDNRVFNVPEIATQPAVVILTGRKNLLGGALGNGMFSFIVIDSAENTVATGTNLEDGSIQFSAIEFNTPGVFTFTVEEVVKTDTGIIFDGTIFTVTVTVVDNGSGTLEADVAYPSGGIVFNNRLVTTPAMVTLTGRKNLIGGTLESGMFSFVINDSAGNMVAIGVNDADGSIQFSSIEFDTPGVFTFTVEEVKGTDSRITYDGTIFTVTVTVTNDGSGTLVAEVSIPSGGIVFNNSIETASVAITLTGTKNLTGRTLVSGMFRFLVKDSAGNIVAAGSNDAGGNIQFTSIVFDTPGVFTFTVEEVRGTDNRITYDTTVFTVTVTVTENGSGNLVAEVTYPSGGIVFNNSFTPRPELPHPCCIPRCKQHCESCKRDTDKCVLRICRGKPVRKCKRIRKSCRVAKRSRS